MAAFTPAEMDRLAGEGRVERIVRRAVAPLGTSALAVVREGWFRVFRNAAFVRDVTLVLAGPGEVLAPGTLFGDRSAESGVEAITDAGLLLVAPQTLARLGEAEPALYARIARDLARRTLRVQCKLEAFSRANVEARVAAALLEIAAQGGSPVAHGGLRLDLPLSQEDLAGLAGTTRESCSSAVAGLARAGLVRGSRLRGLVLLDPVGLAELSSG